MLHGHGHIFLSCLKEAFYIICSLRVAPHTKYLFFLYYFFSQFYLKQVEILRESNESCTHACESLEATNQTLHDKYDQLNGDYKILQGEIFVFKPFAIQIILVTLTEENYWQ